MHQMRIKLGERGIFACRMQPDGVIFSKNARLAVNTVFLQYLDSFYNIRCFFLYMAYIYAEFFIQAQFAA